MHTEYDINKNHLIATYINFTVKCRFLEKKMHCHNIKDQCKISFKSIFL